MENQNNDVCHCSEFRKSAFSLFQSHKETLHRVDSLFIEPIVEFRTYKERLPPMENNTNFFETLVGIVDASLAKPMLGHGDSGVGKTSLGLRLCAHFWNLNCRRQQKWIPIFFPLPSLIDEILTQVWTTPVRSEPVLLIIDTFEAALESETSNTCFDKLCDKFDDFQIIILCREDALPETKVEREFMFRRQNILTNFMEFELKPWNPSQMNLYVSNFVQLLKFPDDNGHDVISLARKIYKTNFKDQDTVLKQYIEHFESNPDLYLIAATPMVLQTLLTVLPILMTRPPNEPGAQVSKIAITDTFIFELFKFKSESYFLQTEFIQPRLSMTAEHLIMFFQIYSKNLSKRFIKDSKVFDSVIEKEQTLEFTLAEPNDLFEEELFSLYKLYFEHRTEDDDEVKIQKEYYLRVLRDACPLQMIGDKYYRFLHYSYELYFAAKGIYDGIVHLEKELIDRKCSSSALTFVKPIKDWNILIELAERLKLNLKEVQILKNLITMSTSIPLDVVGSVASNAASVLCQAGVSFCKEDLRHSRLKGAFLSGGLFLGTDFRGADLSYCTFQSAWLKSAQLQGANLKQLDLGIGDTFHFDRSSERTRFWDVTDITSFRFENKTVEDYWLACFGNKIFEYHIQIGKCVKEIEAWGDEDFNVHGLHTLHCAKIVPCILAVWCANGREVKVYSLPDLEFLYLFDWSGTEGPSPPNSVKRRGGSKLSVSHVSNYFGALYYGVIALFKITQKSATQVRVLDLGENFDYMLPTFTLQETGLIYTQKRGIGSGIIFLNCHWESKAILTEIEFPFEDITFFDSCVSFVLNTFTWFMAGSSNGSIVYFRYIPSTLNQSITPIEVQGHSKSSVNHMTFGIRNDEEAFVASCSDDAILVWRVSDMDGTLNVFRIISYNYFGGVISLSPDCQSLAFAPARFNHFEVHSISILKKKLPRLETKGKYYLDQEVRQLIILSQDTLVVIINSDSSQGFHKARQGYDIRGKVEFYDNTNGIKKSTCMCNGYIVCGVALFSSSDIDILVGMIERVEYVTNFTVCGLNQVLSTVRLTNRFVDIGKQAVLNTQDCWIALSESRSKHDSIHFYKFELNFDSQCTLSISCIEICNTLIELTLPKPPSKISRHLKVTTTRLFCDDVRKYLAFGTTGEELHIISYQMRENGSLEINPTSFIWNLGGHARDIKSESTDILSSKYLVVTTVMGIHIFMNTSDSEWKHEKYIQCDAFLNQSIIDVSHICIMTLGSDGVLLKIRKMASESTPTEETAHVEQWSSYSQIQLFQTCRRFVFSKESGGDFILWFCGKSTNTLACLKDIRENVLILWSKSPSSSLVLSGCNIDRCYGLTPNYLPLLKDRGTVGSPIVQVNQLPSYHRLYSHISELFREIPGTTDAHHFSVIRTETTHVPSELSENQWIISAVVKRQYILSGFFAKKVLEGFKTLFSSLDCHVFVVIEGIKHRRRFIVRADLVLDGGEWDGIGKQATITMFSWQDFEKFKKLTRNYVAKQFCLSGVKGQEIIFKMYEDRWKIIPYSRIPLFNNWLSQWFSNRVGKELDFNCITWVDNLLSEHLQDEYINSRSKSWHNFFIILPSEIVHENTTTLSKFSELPLSVKFSFLILLLSILLYAVI